jgi:hypothetical protein
MSDKTNPTGSNNFTAVDLLPRYYQSIDNKKFVQATLDQLVQTGTAKKLNGYIGRINAKSADGKDIYINAPTKTRQNYQLEPAVVINDSNGNPQYFKDYQDYINQLSTFGSNVSDQQRLNHQEFYSWDPHIEWDKFVNFQQYYWLPYGPDAVTIYGQQLNVTSTYTVEIKTSATQQKEFVFTPNGLDRNPLITLYRGQTYYFEINSPGEPFSFKTARTTGIADRYTDEGYIDKFGVTSGTIKFTVPLLGPDTLYYVSERDADLGGFIKFADVTENSFIDINNEILGKKTYKLSNGTALSNGMKVKFAGHVTPQDYATGEYYVEGVGSNITLIPTTVFEVMTTYSEDKSIEFDTTLFDQYPFASATSYANQVDYITINRASKDHNPWSRYNRWFHKDVITASAEYNNKLPDYDQASRAVRPIIEFESNLKLFNFGSMATTDVDLVDNYTKDAFTTIEGTPGYNVDNIQLTEGMRVLFTADTDSIVKNNIYKVSFVNIQNSGIGVPQIRLILDQTPLEDTVVIVRQGQKYQGSMFWFNGVTWNLAQQKTKVNQPPLFDLVDNSLQSFSTYPGSTFLGSKIFSYVVGNTTADAVLGFALSYQNIANIGDIKFEFNLLSDTFEYKSGDSLISKSTNTGYLSKLNYTDEVVYKNGWQTSTVVRSQPALRVYKNSQLTNNFPLDIYDNKTDLVDLEVRIYINGVRLDSHRWSLIDSADYKKIKLVDDISLTDVLTIKSFAKQPINSNGYYELPINLQNNPLNKDMTTFTLGEVSDHVNSIVDNIQSMFVGTINGSNNFRDLGNIASYGTKFVQHSGPASLGLYHITSDKNNIVRALEKARDDYGKFKRSFLIKAQQLGVDTNVYDQVNQILVSLAANKTKQQPYYFSDMLPFTGKKTTTLTVVDSRIRAYPLTDVFNNTALTNKAVSIYLNGVQPPQGIQLLHGLHYIFTEDGYVNLTDQAIITEGDTLTIFEYDSTDGCFVPPTPTKLGLWPKYEPKIYLDTSLVTPQLMIQGHDGSQTLAYGDYRDNIIIELEKRIYNNIQIVYNPAIFDLYDIMPGYYRTTEYSLEEFNLTMAPSFYKWANLAGRDFAKPVKFNKNDSFTYNYAGHFAPDGRSLPGYWKGILRWVYDTDRPNICPWEMLGFTEEPTWWQDAYGPAPYTSNNTIMWKDLSVGAVKIPGQSVEYRTKFARPSLIEHLPVDESGNLVNPVVAHLASGTFTTTAQGHYIFGDVGPVEHAWRRSSYYPFSVLITLMLLKPAHTFATCLDRSRTVRNLCGQLVYSTTNLRITPKDIVLPSIYSSKTRVQTSGIINYLVELLTTDNVMYYNEYRYNLDNLNVQLSYRISGFTSKDNLNLILDSKNPASSGNVFVPQENYKIVYNNSSPVKKLSYSGVIITKLADGWEIKGYSLTESFFKYYPYLNTGGIKVNVGGISASFINWTPNRNYVVGQVVLYAGKYYRTVVNTVSGETFESNLFAVLPQLPVTGGVNATFRQTWDTSTVSILPYGTVLPSSQQVVDFLLGYGEYLKSQGFVFEDFNNNLLQVQNWETSTKEFLFWTTQKWSANQDSWEQWVPNKAVKYGAIIKYNDEYYKAIQNSPEAPIFIIENYIKLDGLDTVGSAVISLSPASNSLAFTSELSVADDINNPFNDYEIFKVDGTALPPTDVNAVREGNKVTFSPIGDNTIYNASFYLIQKEQVVILDNTTVFNDIIYNPESGYRQERMKVSGFISGQWFGGFEIPGFILDRADVAQWKTWNDYELADIVQYQGFYYSATKFLAGTSEFNPNNWTQIKKPEPKLLPNWNYKASQFQDFYNLDEANFDTGQQLISQHLIGYQPRQYLSNIIQDEVSEFQFYQGMIREKGTQNVLNKLFDVLSSDNQESISFYEEWAIRVGQYGASESFEAVEFIIDQPSLTKNPQGFYLTNDPEPSTNFNINLTPNDIYLKPVGYNSNPWPVNNSQKPFLRTPGYVHSDNAIIELKTIDDLANQSIASFRDGMYVWVSFSGASWNIYKFSPSGIKPTTLTQAGTSLTITSATQVDPSILGEYVGFTQVSIAGFYKVTAVNLNTFTVSAPNVNDIPLQNVIESQLEIFRLFSARVKSIDDANDIIKSYTEFGDKIWIDNNSSNKWSTLQLNPVFNKQEIKKPYPTQDMAHGTTIVLNAEGTLAAVSTIVGEVITYEKQGPLWVYKQILKRPFMAQYVFQADPNKPEWFAETMAMSADGEFLAIGSPKVGLTATNTLTNGTVVCDPSGINSTNLATGAVSLYQKTSYNEYLLLFTFVSGDDTAGQQFGSTLVFGDKTLFVGTRGNTATGKQAVVYELRYVAVSGTTIAVTNSNADGDNSLAVVTVTYDGGIASSTYKSINDITFDGGLALSINSTADRWLFNNSVINIPNGTTAGFGLSISVSKDNSILAIGAPYAGDVYIYKLKELNTYLLLQKIAGPTQQVSSATNINGVISLDNTSLVPGLGFRNSIDQFVNYKLENIRTSGGTGSGLIVDAVTGLYSSTAKYVSGLGPQLVVSNISGTILPGMTITGTGIQAGLIVTGINGTTVTISAVLSGGSLTANTILTFTNSNVTTSIRVRDPGNNYAVNDTITVVNPLGVGAVQALNTDLIEQSSLSTSTLGTALTTSNNRAGTGLKVKLASTTTPGVSFTSPLGSTVIPVKSVDNFVVGQPIFSYTNQTAFASGAFITSLDNTVFEGSVSNNILTVTKITAGNDNINTTLLASIDGTTLTAEEVAGSPIIPGMTLSCTGISDNTIILSGSGKVWTINNAQTITQQTIQATLPGKLKSGMQLTNPALDKPAIFTASIAPKTTAILSGPTATLSGGTATLTNALISGTTLTFQASTGAAVVAGMTISGAGITNGTKILYGSALAWTIDTTHTISSFITVTATLAYASINGTVLTFTSSSGAVSVSAGMTLSGGTVLAGTSITGGVGTTWYVDKSQTATCTTATTPYASISGNTLTITSSTGTTLGVGMFLTGGTVTEGTYITSGSGTSWTVDKSQTATCTTATFEAYLVDGIITDNVLTFTSVSGAPLEIGMVLSGTGITTGTYIVSGSDIEWIVSNTFSVPTIPTIITATPVVLTVASITNGTIKVGQRITGSSTAADTAIITSKNLQSDGTGTYYVSRSQTVSTFTATSAWTLDKPRIVTITMASSYISGTTLYGNSGGQGTIRAGMIVSGSTVAPGTTILSGSGPWIVSISQNVAVTDNLIITGTGTGGVGTYVMSADLVSTIVPTNAVSIVINTPTLASLSSDAEVSSIQITSPGVNYNVDDQITFNTGAGTITTKVTSVTSNATIKVSTIGNGSIIKDAAQFGTSIALSDNAEFLAIGSPLYSGNVEYEGRVAIYSNNFIDGNFYSLYQNVVSPYANQGDLFGSRVAFAGNYKTLLVYSAAAENSIPTTFDVNQELHSTKSRLSTTFDTASLNFKEITQNSGRIDVYDKYQNNWIAGEWLSTDNATADGFGQGFAVSADTILVGAPHETEMLTDATNGVTISETNSGKVYSYHRIPGTTSWSTIHEQTDLINLKKIKQAFLYNKVTNKLIRYLDVIDPYLGKIAGPAEQEISYKTFYDPAIYTVGDDTVNVDNGTAWASKQVGKLWWDLNTSKFIDNHSADLIYRNSTLNVLAHGASVDIYEWVESSLSPEAWLKVADTNTGLSKNISGKPLYTNVYSVKQTFDTFNQAFKNTYYFWVKNKAIVPNVTDRKLSAKAVSDLIANPRGSGYSFLTLTGNNSFSLVNCKNLLNGSNIVLGVEYWLVENTTQNIHTQWKLIDNNPNTRLPQTIETKWFDSLCGKDQADRPVPDLKLPAKLRYGIESRPRQGMFVNNLEALKQFVEKTNLILIKEQIVQQKNISKFDSYDVEPALVTNLYDIAVDTELELRLVPISTVKNAMVDPIITNGIITGVTIVVSGSGYKTAPTITVVGTGKGAILQSSINVAGQVVGVTIIEGGRGYVDNTSLNVREFSVLVHADGPANGNWSIYSYVTNPISLVKEWVRARTQSYDVRKYWFYADWYETGFTQFTVIDYSIETFAELNLVDADIGQTVKIRVAGDAGWQLLVCYSKSTSIDWTSRYRVVGVQNGTIQLSSKLYDFQNSIIGYDGSIYDSIGYDFTAARELRIILNSLKDDILTDTLKQTYLELFFTSLRYAHTEQTYIDWAFKTSFVKAKHNVGSLKQTITYKNDNLANFQDYISEVVPYRTTVREYISNYNSVDNSSSMISDFDLPAIFKVGGNDIINTSVVNGKIISDNTAINEYPWKNWVNNVGFEITDIIITNSGSGYVTPPTVRIINDSGSGAVAKAFIANGKVNRVQLVSPGKGFLSTPKIIIDGGGSASGITATAIAIIGNSVTRSSLIKIKFDRTTQKYYTIQLNEIEYHKGTGSRTNFPLKWPPDIKIGQSIVKIDDVIILRDDYILSIVKSTSKGYTSYSGSITFKTAPQGLPSPANITIEYIKDISLLNATDRIQYFYNPEAGQLGKDLGQLMTGVDYGGVLIQGVDYSVAKGWNSVGFMTDLWDSYENTYNDYIVSIDSTTSASHMFTLPYMPEVLSSINIYYTQISKQTVVSDGSNTILQIGTGLNTISLTASIVKSITGISTTATATSIDVVTISETQAGFNFFKGPTANLIAGRQVQFIAGVIGGPVINQIYFIKQIINDQTFTISDTLNGSEFILIDANGTMSMQYNSPTNYITGPTSALTVGMGIQFFGTSLLGGLTANTTYFVKQIINATTYTISNKVNGTVLSLTSSKGTMIVRQVAAAPTLELKLNNTTGLKVGDTVTAPVAGAIADGTVITKIVNINTININTILYGDLLSGTELTFVRILNTPRDFRYLTNVTIKLSEAVVAGGIIKISAPLDPVRIDDENFGKIWIITKTEATTNIITTITPITFQAGDQIEFTGIEFGNLQTATTYYIESVLSNRTFKITARKGGPEYVVSTQTGSLSAKSIRNPFAIMPTYISDGTEPIITIPVAFDLPLGDLLIFRKNTSDGAVAVNDADLDTQLDGGNLIYSTATGLSADDIFVDGDGFVTPTSSAGPEEMVPGQVVDAVAIKVFDRPSDGSANIKILNYVADGTNKKFDMGQFPNSKDAIFVKLDQQILTTGTDYYIDYINKKVVLVAVPTKGKVITLHNFGFNGTNLLDVDYFVADGKTKEFITKAPYINTPFTYLVYLDGNVINPTIFKTDTTYESPNRIGFRFSIAPNKFSVLNYLIISGSEQTYAIFKNEKIATNGSTSYTLTNTVGSSLPLETSVIVRANQTILKGPNSSYFTIASNQYTYTLDSLAVQPYSINTEDITVYAAGNLLALATDYTVDTAGVSISINKKIYSTYKGKQLVVSIESEQDYSIVGNKITFNTAYGINDYIEIISAYKHNILQIQRSRTKVTNNLQFSAITPSYYRYVGVLGGKVDLQSPIADESRLWLTKNRVLLINGIDYKVNPDLASVTLAMPPSIGDEFESIIFAGTPVKQGLSYMQFKDMLNRTVYKRLNLYKQSALTQDLHYYDNAIYVKDAGNFDKPNPKLNKPGIIEINGERIEYFTIKNNTTLGQLRRGTLGTGVPTVHGAGSRVQDIGPSETIPYIDTYTTEQVTVDGISSNTVIPLSFIPSKNDNWVRNPSDLNLFDSAEIQHCNVNLSNNIVLVTYSIPQQTYMPVADKKLTVAGNISKFNGEYAVVETNNTQNYNFTPLEITSSIVSGTSVSVTFRIAPQDTLPTINVYYIISGATPTGYNKAYLCTNSTLTSITLNITTNYGTFAVLPSKIASTHTVTLYYSSNPGVFNDNLVTTLSAPRYGQSDEIDVFVGGYDDSTVWAPNTIFEADQIITLNSYTYVILYKHKSGATFNSPVVTLDEQGLTISTSVPATSVRTFFVGNIRLKKAPYSVYNVANSPTSPEGDVAFKSDFSVDGINSELVLSNKLTAGTVVTIYRRSGKTWTETGVSLQDSQTKIAKFITAVPGIWISGNQITATATVITTSTASFDNVKGTFDSDTITFDQGN